MLTCYSEPQVVAGQQQEARDFLLNAERLICFRGIPKPVKSKRVKMLHHIYLFLRVIEESTNIYTVHIPPESLSFSDRMLFPSLRLSSLRAGRDLDFESGGDFEYGLLGEFHHDPYQPAKIFFGKIYGFPLQLLSFISRVCYLANVVRAFQSPGITHDLNPSPELETHITALENEICYWDKNQMNVFHDDDEPVVGMSANHVTMSPLTTAIHSAIIIYFYRCVRIINPLLLQPYVEKTILNLELFEEEMRKFSLVNCGIVWPGFIAAAEALEPGLQARAYDLLRRNATNSGMRNFDVAADFALNLWRLRDENQNPNLTWVDIVRTQQSVMILT